MLPDLHQRIQSHGALIPLTGRACFRLTGGDRVRYLNGQVTNDVRKVNAAADSTLYACVTDAKGRITGDVFIHAADEALWIDAESDLRDVLGPRLERYIISDDAELTDVTDDWRVWHLFGPAAEAFTSSDPQAQALPQARVLKSNRLGNDSPGIDLWLPAGAESSLPALPCPTLSAEDSETLRILRGIPRWPQELSADTFPPEAGLEDRAMSYTKGCYIGQEVLSRIRSSGKMPRTLLHWRADPHAAAGIAAGDNLYLDGNEKPIGAITSIARHPVTDETIGLAFVKQGSTAPDSTLLAGKAAPSIAARIFPLLSDLP